MEIKAINITKGTRKYVREDGTLWSVEYDTDERVWCVWQVDEQDEIVYDDPRNQIWEEGHCFEVRLSWALNRIKDNR